MEHLGVLIITFVTFIEEFNIQQEDEKTSWLQVT